MTDEPLSRTARYRMLETVREFGALALAEAGEQDRAQEAVYRWAVDLSRHEVARLEGPTQVPAMLTLRVEQENLLHVLRSALADDRADVVLPVFHALGLYWSLRGAHSEVVGLAGTCSGSWSAGRGGSSEGPRRARRAADPGGGDRALPALGHDAQRRPCDGVRAAARLRRLRREGDIGPRAAALTDLVADIGDPVGREQRLAGLHESDDRYVAFVTLMLSAQLAENAGRLQAATVLATASHAVAARSQDTWGSRRRPSSSPSSPASRARPPSPRVDGTRPRGFGRLHADEDLRQLDWLEATNLVRVGRAEDAEPLFISLVETDDDPVPSGLGGTARELRSIGHAGLAEVAAARGDHVLALRELELANTAFGSRTTRRSPWYTMFAAGWLSAMVLPAPGTGTWEPDPLPGPEAERLARELRVRMVAGHRAAPDHVDFPSSALPRSRSGRTCGPCVTSAGSTTVSPSSTWRPHGRAPGRAVAAHAPHDTWARALHGDVRVDEAGIAVGRLAHDDLPTRVMEILRAGPWTRPTA
ncbi:hypothetical protein NKG05_30065 [Oerskovia sp. M15]